MNVWGREFLRHAGYEVADDAEITFEDDYQTGGYCETCYYTEYIVRVSDGVQTATYWGDMSDLIHSMNEGVFY